MVEVLSDAMVVIQVLAFGAVIAADRALPKGVFWMEEWKDRCVVTVMLWTIRDCNPYAGPYNIHD